MKNKIVVQKATGEVANFLWGQESLYHSIKITDNTGIILVRDGKNLGFSFGLIGSGGVDPREWLIIGIKVAAIAFALWFLCVTKLIVSAIAFLAFNLMLLAILALAVGALVGIIE